MELVLELMLSVVWERDRVKPSSMDSMLKDGPIRCALIRGMAHSMHCSGSCGMGSLSKSGAEISLVGQPS